MYREGIVNTLRHENGFDVVAVLDNDGLLEVVESKRPDVVITSIQSAHTDIASAIRVISKKYPHIAVLTISNFEHVQTIVNMVRAGANGCLLRSAEKAELFKAIRCVITDGYYYSMQVVAPIANIIAKKEFEKFHIAMSDVLTEKEKSFIQLLCKGYSIKEISSITGVSIRTIEHRKEKVYGKLGKQNVVDLMNYAILNGLYNPYESAGYE
jgi:DNA-binding NarL/FixJ family response regulator